MNRRQLATRLAEKTGLSARRADQILQVLPELVAGELARAGRLEWRGLGTFAVRRYPPRQIHVPATGQTIDLPARAGVTFKPSRNLLSALPQSQPEMGRLTPDQAQRKGPSPRRKDAEPGQPHRFPDSPAMSTPAASPLAGKQRKRKVTPYVGSGYCELCTYMWPDDWKPTLTGRGLFRCLGCNQVLDVGLRMEPTRAGMRPIPRPANYRREDLKPSHPPRRGSP